MKLKIYPNPALPVRVPYPCGYPTRQVGLQDSTEEFHQWISTFDDTEYERNELLIVV